MTNASSAAHLKRASGFARSSTPRSILPWRTRLALAAVPLLLLAAHLAFGANQSIAALWLSGSAGLALLLWTLSDARRGLHDISPVTPLAVLWLTVIFVGLWSLTPWAPGSAHPLWIWSGNPTGSLTIDRSATVIELVKLMGLAAMFVLGALHGVRRDRAQATVAAVLLTGGVFAVIALITFMAGAQLAQGSRLAGTFLSANNAATFFGVLMVLGLAVFLRAWRRKAGLPLAARIASAGAPLACLLLIALCLIMTASRMGLIAGLAGCFALLGWETATRSKARLPVGIAALALLGLVLALVLGGNAVVLSRVGEVGVDLTTRGHLFAAHWDAFVASPLFGYGLGTFDAVNVQMLTVEGFDRLWSIRAAHNVYLQWLEEAGLVGALPMFALLLVIMVTSLNRALSGRGLSVQRGLLCANIVVLIHGLTDYALQVPSIAALWAFLLGIQFAFGRAGSS